MAWVKVSDNHYRQPDMRRASPHAKLVHGVARCYIAEHLTDGHISRQAIPDLALDSGLGRRVVERVARELVSVGLWGETTDGWFDRKYLETNPNSDEVLEKRRQNNERQKRFQARRHKESEAENNAVTNAGTNDPPYPYPSRTQILGTTSQADVPSAGDADTVEISRGGGYGQDAPAGGAATAEPQGQDTRTGAHRDDRGPSTVETPSHDGKPRRANWRPTDGESTSAYRDRLRRAYLDARPGQTRNDIAYAWACHIFGQERVKYGAVMALLRKAGTFDAFLRAISRTADQGEMEDPVAYAMGVVGQDQRRGTGNVSGFRQRMAAGISHRDADPDFEMGLDLDARKRVYNSLPKSMSSFRRRQVAGISLAEADPDFEQ